VVPPEAPADRTRTLAARRGEEDSDRPSAILALAVAGLAVTAVLGAPAAPAACRLAGSWVAGTAQVNRYFHATNPTATRLAVARGGLTATFDHGTFVFGGLGIGLKAELGSTKLAQEIDIEAAAPDRSAAGRIVLSRGTYKLHYVRAKLTTHQRITRLIRLPDQSSSTPGGAVPYSCTGSTLRLRVPVGAARGVTLTLHWAQG